MKNIKLLIIPLIFLILVSACSPENNSLNIVNVIEVTSTPTKIIPTSTVDLLSTPTQFATVTEMVPTPTEVVWDLGYSTAEEQGMSTVMLEDMRTTIEGQYPFVDSILIMRNGKIVFELYQNDFGQGDVHRIYSGAKSILSILVGIAINKGYIESVDVPLTDFFPYQEISFLGPRKEAVTLEHLLTMTSGIQCLDADSNGLDWWVDFLNSPDWVSTFIGQPMISEPGEEFYYCDGSANLISAIIQDAVGVPLIIFANENLFEPLGIDEIYWHQLWGGYVNGSTGVHIKPEDFAKIGSLLLTDGKWQGEQIVSGEWVAASTARYVEGSFSDWYGYYWWIDNEGYISAFGLGNQLLYVIPEENLVVVIFSYPEEGRYYDIYSEEILENLILPAIYE